MLLLNGYIILKESLLLDGLTLAIFSSIFVGKMCIFVSRPMKIVTLLRKKRDPAKRVVDFPLQIDTFRNKIMEIVKDFEAKYNNNGTPWKSSRILRLNPIFSFFFLFSSFFSIFSFFFQKFFSFFSFFIFSFFFSYFLFFHFSFFEFF